MQTIGKKGEEEAARFLKQEGFEILEKNYRFKRSEIDLICKGSDTLIFIEVKTRSSSAFGEPETFVSESQQNSIIRAAEHFIEENQWQGDIRFDVIAILKTKGSFELEHFKDAFY